MKNNADWEILKRVDDVIKNRMEQIDPHLLGKPSEPTKIFMSKIEMEIQTIKEKLEKMPTRDEMLLCMEKAIDSALERIDIKLDNAISKKADKTEVENTKEEIKAIKGDIRWVVYTIIGFVITAILGFVFLKP